MQADMEVVAMDDADDATVISGSKMAENGPVEGEILVRFQLPIRPNAVHAKHLLAEVLVHILQAFPNAIVYIDNKQEEFACTDTSQDATILTHVKNSSMTAHAVKSKQRPQDSPRWIIVLKFRSTVPFRDWKKQDTVIAALRKYRIYMTPHKFAPQDWDIISLGFLLGIHVVQFPLEAAKELVERLLKFTDPNPPEFTLTPTKVQMKGKPSYTRSYEVVCRREDGQKLYHMLTHDQFREPTNKIFIPYSLKRTNTSTFISMIKENNQMLSDSYVMKFHGIPPTSIGNLESKILGVPGVRYVVPTSKTFSHGEWRILIKASKFASVNGIIRQNWKDWCTMVSDSVSDLPDSYPAPAITSKNARYTADSDKASEDSYGTLLSTASTLTVETMTDDDDRFDTCPLDETMPSYAQVLTGISVGPPATSAITPSMEQTPYHHQINSTNSKGNNWTDETRNLLQERLTQQDAFIQELHQAKAELAQRIENISEEVQNKECRTKELENAIATLLTIVADREKQMAEKDQQFELRNRQFDALMAKLELQSQLQMEERPSITPLIAQGPATPARSNKRQNTLPTPTRDKATPDTPMDTATMMTFTNEISPRHQC